MQADDDDDLEPALRAFLAHRPEPIVAAYLFGSRARGTHRPTSDIDLAVLLSAPPAATLAGRLEPLALAIEERLGRAVDITLLDEASPDLVHRVLRDGRLVLERDRARRVAFEVRRRAEYFDLLPLLRRIRRPGARAAATPLCGCAGRAEGRTGDGPVTDPDLVEKRLAYVEARLRELRERADPDRIDDDVEHERFVEHTLQVAIQAVLDVASHVVSDERLGEPATNRGLFALLARAGVLPRALAERLAAMAGFRNVLVHLYDEVDLERVKAILRDHLGDLDAFVATVREWLAASDGPGAGRAAPP